MKVIATSNSLGGYSVTKQNEQVMRSEVLKSISLVMNKGIPIKTYISSTKPALSSS